MDKYAMPDGTLFIEDDICPEDCWCSVLYTIKVHASDCGCDCDSCDDCDCGGGCCGACDG